MKNTATLDLGDTSNLGNFVGSRIVAATKDVPPQKVDGSNGTDALHKMNEAAMKIANTSTKMS